MSSKKVYLELVNLTQYEMTITINNVDSKNWSGDKRPDKNFNNVTIKPYQAKTEEEEINLKSSNANFQLNIKFSNGDQLILKIDQHEGLQTYRRLYSGDQVAGANREDYIVFQNNDDDNDRNRFEITSRIWLQNIDDTKKIHEITIPGTHDSCTFASDLSYVQCQNQTIHEQLKFGIRFLDIRCKAVDNKFHPYHGSIRLGLDFKEDVRDVCINFLRDHPSEFIIMSIKKEGSPSDSDLSFDDILKNYIKGHDNYFYTKHITTGNFPTVQEVKGKIVIFSRYSGNTIGVDGYHWKDNQLFKNQTVKLRVQDQYKVEHLSKKWSSVKDALEEAPKHYGDYLYLNFCSGVGDSLKSPFLPQTVADVINSNLLIHTGKRKNNRYGIVIMDFPSTYPPPLSPISQNKYNAVVRSLICANYDR